MDMHFHIDIDAPASEAWRVLGEEFGAIGDWGVGIAASELIGDLGVGAGRTCEGEGWGPFPAGTVTEELYHFDREAMEFSYRATSGLPWFLTQGLNRWSIEALGPERCIVRSHATIGMVWWMWPLAPLMLLMTRSALKQLKEEVKYTVEHGRPHPRKLVSLTAQAG